MSAALPDPVAVVSAIMAGVRTRMPTLAEMTAADVNNHDVLDMGPDVTLPAIHMHLIMQHVEALRLEARITEQTSIGMAPDDVGDARSEYAAAIAAAIAAAVTVSLKGNFDEAVGSLIHAAASILATKYEGQIAARALEVGAAMFADDIRRNFSPAGALQ